MFENKADIKNFTNEQQASTSGFQVQEHEQHIYKYKEKKNVRI